MANLDQSKKEVYCVYFIENHISTINPKLTLTGDSGGLFGKLEGKKEKTYVDRGKNEKYDISIYHFEIYPERIRRRDKKEFKIKLTLESEGCKFEYKKEIKDLDKDTFIYDIEFKDNRIVVLQKKKVLKMYRFPRNEQFGIYKDYLENDLGIKRKDNKKRMALAFFTEKLFQEKFLFSFYILIFIELFPNTKYLKNHINNFHPLNIDGKGDLGKYQVRSMNFIEMLKKKLGKIMDICKDEKEKETIGIKVFAFILCYFYEFDHNNFLKNLENGDKEAQNYIDMALVKYRDYFLNLKLKKEKVQKLIDISKTFLQLSNALKYLDALSDLLDLVKTNFKKFEELYLAESKKEDLEIDIET